MIGYNGGKLSQNCLSTASVRSAQVTLKAKFQRPGLTFRTLSYPSHLQRFAGTNLHQQLLPTATAVIEQHLASSFYSRAYT